MGIGYGGLMVVLSGQFLYLVIRGTMAVSMTTTNHQPVKCCSKSVTTSWSLITTTPPIHTMNIFIFSLIVTEELYYVLL